MWNLISLQLFQPFNQFVFFYKVLEQMKSFSRRNAWWKKIGCTMES